MFQEELHNRRRERDITSNQAVKHSCRDLLIPPLEMVSNPRGRTYTKNLTCVFGRSPISRMEDIYEENIQ